MRAGFGARLSRVHTIAIKGLPETIRFVDILRPDLALRLTRNGATPKMDVLFVSDTQARTSPPGADLQFVQGRRCPQNMSKSVFQRAPRFRTRVEGMGVEEVVIRPGSPSANVSTTSSSSMSVICDAFYRAIFNISMRREPSFPEQGLSRATPCATLPPQARLSLFPNSAGCTPAANVAPA
jgi:hypothetical protein